MSKVKLDLIKQPADSILIKQLENLLTQAKSGELQGLVFVCSYRGNFVNHGWSRLTNRMRLIGELEQVKWHLLSLDP